MPKVRIDAPANMDRLSIAQALVGTNVLLKAVHQPGQITFGRYRAMRELNDKVAHTYEALLQKMMERVHASIEKEILDGQSLTRMGKSNGFDGDSWRAQFHTLTPEQERAIRGIIEDYHAGFIATTIDPALVPPDVIQRLIDTGIVPSDLNFVYQPTTPSEKPPERMDWIRDAYEYGSLMGGTKRFQEKENVESLSLMSFEKRRKRRKIQTTPHEESAIDSAKHSAGIYCRGLGNRVASDFSTTAIEADHALRARMITEIKTHAEANIAKRDTWRKLASELGHKTGDWARDFQRIAATEKQRAMQQGFASSLTKREGDPEDIRVAKLPAPDACPDCNRLHLTAGPGSPPRIFSLADLHANGTNVGKKRRTWRATVGPVHPWCGCELIHVPPGWGFNDDGEMVPKRMIRSAADFERDLMKSQHLAYTQTVPEHGCAIRVGDPHVRSAIEEVIARTPEALFNKRVGVTLITTDIPRAQNPLEEHDLAYWTGNEIRLMQTINPDKVHRVLEHELGHGLNVHLLTKLGSVDKVKRWHKKLWAISKREGWVSDYAKREPIENAAEVTREYLYRRSRFMLRYPKQFAFVHRWYRDVIKRGKR